MLEGEKEHYTKIKLTKMLMLIQETNKHTEPAKSWKWLQSKWARISDTSFLLLFCFLNLAFDAAYQWVRFSRPTTKGHIHQEPVTWGVLSEPSAIHPYSSWRCFQWKCYTYRKYVKAARTEHKMKVVVEWRRSLQILDVELAESSFNFILSVQRSAEWTTSSAIAAKISSTVLKNLGR